ncbi:MAG TPA: hypothetical protein VN457_00480, partial [Chlamydiales bacterium]|nr:hypothetical protein [Chlamydiales bacterium]
ESIKKLIEASFPLLHKTGPFIVTSAEEILQAILLHYHGITKKDLDEYQNRPRNIISTGIMMHVPKTSKIHGKGGDPCVAFLKDFAVAKTAFKALADCALLKAWEFTMASFSEVKLDFARFNLYASLGINYDDRGGIGERLYSIISRKIDDANAYLKERQDEYDQIADHTRYVEQRMRTASTEKEIEWIKVEYQSRKTELYHIEELRRIAYEKASKVGKLHNFLINEYDKKFRDYFQEVYDPEIHDFASGPFDDSPAGFRLLYKHGRSNPSLWTRIFTLSEFVESLVSFFTATEQEMQSADEIKGVESEFSMCVTELVNHVRSNDFLESAFWRIAKAYNAPLVAKPLENLDKIEKKPWVYTSGGSMSILVSSYFGREEKPTEVARWVESETELLAFFLDTLKQIPKPVTNNFVGNCN